MISVISSLSEMRGLEPEWNRLGAQFDTPLLQFDWFCACAESLHNEADLRIFVYRYQGRVKAIAPLVLRKHSLVNWLEIIGTTTLYEPAGLLYEDRESLISLIKAIIASGYPSLFLRIPSVSPICELLNRSAGHSALTIKRPTAGSYYLSTNTNWDDFHAKIGKKWRADFRNKSRRAEQIGTIKTDLPCPNKDQLPELLRKAIDIEAQSWKGRQGSSLRDNSTLKHFFMNYTERACEKGILRLFFFTINELPIAMNLGVEFANGIWFFKTGFNDEWSHVSPGMQLSMETIKYAVAKNLDRYEFLGSEEPWQKAWPVQSHGYYSIIILPYSLRGIIGLCEIMIRFFVKKLFK